MMTTRRLLAVFASSLLLSIGTLTAALPAQAASLSCLSSSPNYLQLGFGPTTTPLNIQLPLHGFVGTVDWGGTVRTYAAGDPEPSFTLSAGDDMWVCINGTATGFGGRIPGTAGWHGSEGLTTVEQWGNLGSSFTNLDMAFWGTPLLTDVPAYLPSTITSTVDMFWGSAINDQDISLWNTSHLTNIAGMFSGATFFDRDISTRVVNPTGNQADAYTAWDTSNVEDMASVFSEATHFNQNIGNWDTSNVVDMNHMFSNAEYFDQNLSGWDTSNVENMASMFSGAQDFGLTATTSVGGWDTSHVFEMNSMFSGAASFNEYIGDWNTSSVGTGTGYLGPGDTAEMFAGATSFNQDISRKGISGSNPYVAWDTSNVVDMHAMFRGAHNFNSDITNWNTSNVEYMDSMFADATNFNQDISDWNTSNVEYMDFMFADATNFNQDISDWITSNVDYMSGMFAEASSFNQDISDWNTSNVEYMDFMFFNATVFDQDVSSWSIGEVVTALDAFAGSALSTSNYSSLLAGWSAQPHQSNVDLTSDAHYFDTVQTQRDLLVSDGWVILDSGPIAGPSPTPTPPTPAPTPTPTPTLETASLVHTGSDLQGQTSLGWMLIVVGLLALATARLFSRRRSGTQGK